MHAASVMNNEKDVNLQLLYDWEAENIIMQEVGVMRRFIAEILLHIDDRHMNDAEKWIQKAIEYDDTYGLMFWLGQDYVVYAELFQKQDTQ